MSDPIDIESNAVAVRPQESQAVSSVQKESFESLMALAKELCTTGFLPQAVKTPAQAVAIILTGRELGLGPMQSLRSICIIQGKPELAADLQLSIFHRDGGRSKWLALTELAAELWLRHPNGDEHRETFTMDDAKRAGLSGGVNWQKYPKAMLRSRAITAGLKSVGFEPLAGAYAPGEVGGPETVGFEPEAILPAAQPSNQATPINTPTTPSPATKPSTLRDEQAADAAAQEQSGEVESETPSGQLTIVGYIVSKNQKETRKLGKFRYGICISTHMNDSQKGIWINTFSKTIYDDVSNGQKVEAIYTKGQYGLDIVSVKEVA